HPLFLNRDITRQDLRDLLSRGLSSTRGSYRAMLELFGIPGTDYKRFMNFLATHDCRVDYREFRTTRVETPQPRRSILMPLPPLGVSKERTASGSLDFSAGDQTIVAS